MRRRKLVLFVAVGFAALLIVVVITLANPRARALYHLRRVAQHDLVFGKESIAFEGHSGAFIRSSAAKELLPELIDLARTEGSYDEERCYRALLLQALGLVDSSREAARRVVVPPDAIEVMASSLASKDEWLRGATLEVLPLDPRLIEAVLKSAPRQHPDFVRRWLYDLVEARPDLVRQEPGNDPPFPDDAWQFGRRDNFGVDFGIERSPEYSTAAVVSRVSLWLERHRTTLPTQVR